MNVTVDIKKRDLVALNFLMAPRIKSNWVALVLFSTIILVFEIYRIDINTAYGIGIAGLTGLTIGAFGLFVGFLFCLAAALFATKSYNSALGVHRNTLAKEGISKHSRTSETVYKWMGVQSMTKSSRYLFIRVGSNLFSILPRRDFTNEQEFKSFCEREKVLRNGAVEPN